MPRLVCPSVSAETLNLNPTPLDYRAPVRSGRLRRQLRPTLSGLRVCNWLPAASTTGMRFGFWGVWLGLLRYLTCGGAPGPKPGLPDIS